MSQRVVITGGNRGIGLELVRHYAQQGAKVMVGCRQASQDLESLAQSHAVEIHSDLDVCDSAKIQTWAKSIERWRQGDPISLLINNAGLLHKEALDSLDEQGIAQQFQVNALGPVRVTGQLMNQLDKGSKVVMVTSRMGSMADNQSGSYYGYRMSKAALNAASVSFAHDLKPRGIALCLVHPGFVKTDMTGRQGNVTPEVSAKGIAARIEELTLEHSGRFVHAEGEVLPW